MPAALIYGPMQALQHVECAGAGRRDWTARLVNGLWTKRGITARMAWNEA